MSNFDEFDLTPRAPTRPAGGNVLFRTPGVVPSDMTSESFGGGFEFEAEEIGKSDDKSNLSDVMEELDVSEGIVEERDFLFHLDSPFGVRWCGGVISSGQGIRRCCASPVLSGETSCGRGSHSIKAVIPVGSFMVRTKVRGGSGALMSKYIKISDMLATDVEYFQQAKHTPAEWELRFDHAKLARYGDGQAVHLSVKEVLRDDTESTVLDYMPTPKKQRTGDELGQLIGPPSPSWVELSALGDELGSIKEIRAASADTPRRKSENAQAIGENFDLLRDVLPRMVSSLAESFC